MKDVQLIENVQRRASKLVKGLKDLVYKQRLRKLQLPSLLYRRIRGDLIQFYKYTHDYYNTESLFRIEEKSRTRGHMFKIAKEHCNKDVRKKFFSLRINNLWNKLTTNIVNAGSLNDFKNLLDNLFGDKKYSCWKDDICSEVFN